MNHEERQIVRTEQILDEMCAALGGRAASRGIKYKIMKIIKNS